MNHQKTPVLPVLWLQGIHRVVIHGIQLAFPYPIEKIDWEELEEDVNKSGVVLHVHGQPIVRHHTYDPGSTASTHIHLQEGTILI